jgi:hypothetical protein
MTLIPHPLYSLDLVPCDFSVSLIEDTAVLKIEVIEAEPQVVLNTLTEQEFQDA